MFDDEKDELLDRIGELKGAVPVGLRSFLRLIVEPDVIEYTKRYIESADLQSRCLVYPYPWSCIREADAHLQNITNGWLGAPGVIDPTWCDNCRKKVIGD